MASIQAVLNSREVADDQFRPRIDRLPATFGEVVENSDGEALIRKLSECSVRETIGAGDAFTAVLALGLLAQWPLDVINDRANAVAAYVCSQSGATPELPTSFSSFFK